MCVCVLRVWQNIVLDTSLQFFGAVARTLMHDVCAQWVGVRGEMLLRFGSIPGAALKWLSL